MGTYVVQYADTHGTHEVQFAWQKAKAIRYFSKLKRNPRQPVYWAAILRVYDPDADDFDCLDCFYTDARYARLVDGYTTTRERG